MAANPTVYLFVVSEEDYPELRRVCVDGSAMAANYSDFAAAVKEFSKGCHEKGGFAIEVQCVPSELVSWCWATRRKIDSHARAEYAALIAGQQYGSGH